MSIITVTTNDAHACLARALIAVGIVEDLEAARSRCRPLADCLSDIGVGTGTGLKRCIEESAETR